MTKPPILLVDDEPDILFSLRGLLRLEFDLLTAESGNDALAILEHRPVHVILTDQRMPQMTGAQLLEQVQAKYPDVVRIMLTGYADIKAVIDAVNRGHIHRYLAKPIDPDDLLEILREACALYQKEVSRKELLREMLDYLLQTRGVLPAVGDGRPEVHALIERAGAMLDRLHSLEPFSERMGDEG
jgi:DNA-binding NtrC family response regulator